MIPHQSLSDTGLLRRIRRGKVRFGGNIRMKIYGRLDCSSGKQLKKENRVFFESEKEAVAHGYRPCGRCMNAKYQD